MHDTCQSVFKRDPREAVLPTSQPHAKVRHLHAAPGQKRTQWEISFLNKGVATAGVARDPRECLSSEGATVSLVTGWHKLCLTALKKVPRDMPACPICSKPLETVRQREGLFYFCSTCNGRALTVPQVRRVLGDRLAAKLLRLMKLSRREAERVCPFCTEPMLVIRAAEPPLELNACRPCSVVWFDAPTYEALPEGTVETTASLALQATELVAEIRLKELKEREREREQEEHDKKKKRKKRRAGPTAIDPQT